MGIGDVFFLIFFKAEKGAALFFFGISSCQILHTAVLWRCDENTCPPTDTNFALHPSQAAFMTHAVCAPFNGIQEAQSNSRPHGASATPLPLDGHKEHVFKRKPQKSPAWLGHPQSENLHNRMN